MLVTPRVFNKTFWILFFLAVAAYLGWMASPIFFGPGLKIINPAKLELTTGEEGFLLIGKTDSRANLTVVGERVYPDNKGYFSKNVGLNRGLNIIEVKAVNRFNKETKKALKIVRE